MDLVLSWYTILLLVSGLSATPAGQTHSRAKRGSLNIITLGALEKQALVDAHNFYRAAVSPTATNMIKMEWDDSLQVVATGFARRCVFGHNPDLATLQLGENNYVKPISGPQPTAQQSLEAAVTLWHTRHTDYTYSSNTCAPTRNCGHYRQLVWHNSYKVGCALVQCATLQNLPNFNGGHFVICNYDSVGNLFRQRPYEEGSPCLNCPVSHQNCENNLCIETTSIDPPATVPGPGEGAPITETTTTAIPPTTIPPHDPPKDTPSVTPTTPSTGTGTGSMGQTDIFIGVGAGLGGALLLFFLILTIWCVVRRKKRAAKEAGHKRHGRGRNNAQVQPENHYIHRQRPGHHDNRDRSHHDLSGRLPRDRLDTPRYPNRSGHVMTNEPEHKYESLKSGSHTYEDINSAYYLDVLPDLQNR